LNGPVAYFHEAQEYTEKGEFLLRADCIPLFYLIRWDCNPRWDVFEELQRLSHRFLEVKNSPYRRYLIRTTKFNHRMSIIKGQRGIGKTTTLVQLLRDFVDGDHFDPRILYIQADHFLMRSISLYEVAEQFQTLV
jgi:ATP-dependent exoDNAse (exonuclease V) alpha subunit